MTFGGTREAPSDWLARFREIEPTAEMLWLGNGPWAVGKLKYDRRLVEDGHDMIVAHKKTNPEDVRPSVLRKARAVMEGFRLIQMYGEDELWQGTAFEDFRERDWRWRTLGDEAFEANLDARERARAKVRPAEARERMLWHKELAKYLIRRRTPYMRVTANLN
jgi:hypothetical protein